MNALPHIAPDPRRLGARSPALLSRRIPARAFSTTAWPCVLRRAPGRTHPRIRIAASSLTGRAPRRSRGRGGSDFPSGATLRA